MIPGTPNISKSISKSTPPSKKISVDEVVADDATKIVESKEDVINFRDNPKQIAEWEKINKVSQKQKQVPKVAQAGRDLFEGKITSRKFRETVEIGKEASEAWWIRQGRENLDTRGFNHGLWLMNMVNRFGWTSSHSRKEEKKEVEHKGTVEVKKKVDVDAILEKAINMGIKEIEKSIH